MCKMKGLKQTLQDSVVKTAQRGCLLSKAERLDAL